MKRLALLMLIATSAHAQVSTDAPKLPGKVSIQQKLGATVPMNVIVRNERGEMKRLGDYFKSGRPVLLNFVYFRCPMLCPITLESTTNALTALKFNIGEDFDVVTLSIDPRDKPSTAADLKEKFVKRYGRLSAANGWNFVTAHDSSIEQITDAAGFQYAYDSKTDQFAHAAALMVLTPDGRLSRYFYGFEYKPRDLRLAIVEASAGKVGNAVDELLLLCFHYDPATGKYSRNAMMVARAGGVTTMLALGGFIFVMFRKERMHQ